MPSSPDPGSGGSEFGQRTKSDSQERIWAEFSRPAKVAGLRNVKVTTGAELPDPVGSLHRLLQVRVFDGWKSLRLPLFLYAFYGISPPPKLHYVDQRREDDPDQGREDDPADDIAEPVASFF